MTPAFVGRRTAFAAAILLGVAAIGVDIWWNFQNDLQQAYLRVGRGSSLIDTHCGPIEYQQAGAGVPLLAIHGSGGGYDQGMAFASPLVDRGIRVIAMSRFGYLRTPMPADASAQAQADAHVCLLDALGIREAGVLGGSAGAPSALQMAIRHPDRVSALILLAPLVYKPPTLANSAPPMAPWIERSMMAAVGSDFLFWSAMHVARAAIVETVLATPPKLVETASEDERARINAMLDGILPVSARAAGLRSDSTVGRTIGPSALESVHAPTLVVAARDDGYGTYAGAEYVASGISGAKFMGFETGGHTWVGHNDAVMLAITALLVPTPAPRAR